MFKGILIVFIDGKKIEIDNGKINFIFGFDFYIGNIWDLKNILFLMDVFSIVLVDNVESFDFFNLGEFKMYNGGIILEEVGDFINVKVIIFF